MFLPGLSRMHYPMKVKVNPIVMGTLWLKYGAINSMLKVNYVSNFNTLKLGHGISLRNFDRKGNVALNLSEVISRGLEEGPRVDIHVIGKPD